MQRQRCTVLLTWLTTSLTQMHGRKMSKHPAAHLVALHGRQQGVALLGAAAPPDAHDAVSACTDDACAVGRALDAGHLQPL